MVQQTTLGSLLDSPTWENLQALDDRVELLLDELKVCLATRSTLLKSLCRTPVLITEETDMPRASNQPGQSPVALLEDRRLTVVKILMTEGPTKASQLARVLNIPCNSNTLGEILDCGWFERSPRGIELTNDGRCAYQRLRGPLSDT